MPPVRPEHSSGHLRGVRTAAFSLAALLLAAVAHLAGGGRLPSPAALVLLVVPLAWGAVALTGRRRGRVSLLAALAVTQIALHEAFMALAGPSCPVATFAADPHGMPGMGGTTVRCVAGMDAMSGHASAESAAMLCAHLAATGALALLLAHGEQLLATVPGLLVGRLARVVTAAVVPTLPRPVRRPSSLLRRRPDEVFVGSLLRRGPPAPTGAAVPA